MISSSNDTPAQSQSVAIIQSPPLWGVTIKVDRPLKYITIMHGGAIDGIELEYAKNDAETTKFSHGTSSRTNLLNRSTVTLGDKENIVAVSGLHGSSMWGVRVLQLSFAICDTSTGKMRVAGPFGLGLSDSTPQPFHITANGSFVALGGFATNTDLSLGQLYLAGKDGGLYGLTFIDIAYPSV
ncbi:hypothetical protein H1R20_g13516, partial [Candolleomyces eurysporus]